MLGCGSSCFNLGSHRLHEWLPDDIQGAFPGQPSPKPSFFSRLQILSTCLFDKLLPQLQFRNHLYTCSPTVFFMLSFTDLGLMLFTTQADKVSSINSGLPCCCYVCITLPIPKRLRAKAVAFSSWRTSCSRSPANQIP